MGQAAAEHLLHDQTLVQISTISTTRFVVSEIEDDEGN